jgi:hypothetical protein
MYSIKNLSDKEATTLKRIIKVRKMLNGFTYSDLSRMTGYSASYLRHSLSDDASGRKYKFVYATLADLLEITVGDK